MAFRLFSLGALAAVSVEAAECVVSTMVVSANGATSVAVSGSDSIVLNTNTVSGNVDEAEINIAFTGRDHISMLVTESLDGGAFTLDIAESSPSDGSSANSGGALLFSGASSVAVNALVLGPLAWVSSAMAQICTEEVADVTITTPSSWVTYTSDSGETVVGVNGDSNYGYDFDLTLDGETMDSFDAEAQALLLEDLIAYYNDESLTIVLETWTDESGNVVVTVSVSGWSEESDASSSHSSTVGSGSVSLSNYGTVGVAAGNDVGFSCASGYENNGNDVCVDQDGCANDACGVGGTSCTDVAAPGSGRSCECSTGYSFNGNTCVDTNECYNVPCDDSDYSHAGSCVDVAAPGTGFECVCNTGYELDSADACVDIPGCDYETCDMDNSYCTDVAAPGTGRTCNCDDGYRMNSGGDFCDEVTCTSLDTVTWSDGRDVCIEADSGDYSAQGEQVCNVATGYNCVYQGYDCRYGNQGSWYPPISGAGSSSFNFAYAYDDSSYGNICACDTSFLSTFSISYTHSFCGCGNWYRY